MALLDIHPSCNLSQTAKSITWGGGLIRNFFNAWSSLSHPPPHPTSRWNTAPDLNPSRAAALTFKRKVRCRKCCFTKVIMIQRGGNPTLFCILMRTCGPSSIPRQRKCALLIEPPTSRSLWQPRLGYSCNYLVPLTQAARSSSCSPPLPGAHYPSRALTRVALRTCQRGLSGLNPPFCYN